MPHFSIASSIVIFFFSHAFTIASKSDGASATVPSGTVLFDNQPSYFCADIADRKGMALQNMDRAERNGALGKLKKTGIGHAPERMSYRGQPGERTKGIIECQMSRFR